MLSQKDKQLIKSSIPVLKESGEALTRHFYSRMFGNHPSLKNMFNMSNQKQGRQQKALALSVLAYAEHIDDPSVLLGALELIGHKHRSLNVTPEQYAIVGENLLGAMQELLGLAPDAPLIQAWGRAYQELAELMIDIETKMYEEVESQDNGWKDWRTFVIAKKEKQTDQVMDLYLEPQDGLPLPAHKEGQYISLRVFVPMMDFYQIRQYSLNETSNPKYYRISVKLEAGHEGCPVGQISHRLHNVLNEGDTLELTMPAGNFTLHAPQQPTVFLGAGIGVSPLYALLKELLEHTPATPVLWMEAYRRAEEQLFEERLTALRATHPSLRQYTFVEDIQQEDKQLKAGQMTLEKALDTPFGKDAQFYLCGPSGFMQAMRQQLRAAEIPDTQIHFEEFNPIDLHLQA